MKKLLFSICIILLFPVLSWGIDLQDHVVAIDNDASPSTASLLYEVTDPGGTPTGKKVTIGNLTKAWGTTTFGSGSQIVWTFNASAGTDPVLTIDNGTFNLSTGALQVGGSAVLTAATGQPLDATLTALAGLSLADVSIVEGTGADAVAVVTSGGANRLLGSNSDNSALEFKSSLSVTSITDSVKWIGHTDATKTVTFDLETNLDGNDDVTIKIPDNGADVTWTLASLEYDNTFTGGNTIGDGGDDQRIVMYKNATNERWSGMTLYFAQCAASMGFGQPAYIQSTGKPGLADADAAATMPAIGLVVVASTDADTPCTILTHGVITDTDWNWTPGNTIYVADGDAGALTATVGDISDKNDVVQVVGIAIHADSILVMPSLTTIVLE